MTDQDFVKLASKLKCNTGNELDVIGMKYETSRVVLDIYGEMENDHEMIVDQFAIKRKNEWMDMELNEAQLKILEIIFRAEVEKVKELRKLKEESENESEQYEKDVQRFGRSDVLFNDFY